MPQLVAGIFQVLNSVGGNQAKHELRFYRNRYEKAMVSFRKVNRFSSGSRVSYVIMIDWFDICEIIEKNCKTQRNIDKLINSNCNKPIYLIF